MSERILIVDDDPDIREVVVAALESEGFEAETASEGEEALDALEEDEPALMILDIVLPDIEGREVFRRMQKERDVPTIFLSRKSDDVDRILGLELGADGYMTKPFNPRELVARVKAVLRRIERASGGGDGGEGDGGEERGEVKECGSLRLDRLERRVFWAGEEVELTKTQFEILAALMERPKKVYSRGELIDKAYGNTVVSERTIDSHVRKIREEFEEVGGSPIETVRGVGFKLNV